MFAATAVISMAREIGKYALGTIVAMGAIKIVDYTAGKISNRKSKKEKSKKEEKKDK